MSEYEYKVTEGYALDRALRRFQYVCGGMRNAPPVTVKEWKPSLLWRIKHWWIKR